MEDFLLTTLSIREKSKVVLLIILMIKFVISKMFLDEELINAYKYTFNEFTTWNR